MLKIVFTGPKLGTKVQYSGACYSTSFGLVKPEGKLEESQLYLA